MYKIKSFLPTFILSILFLTKSFCQIENIWLGGSPGHENDWNYHKNWSKNKVPNEFNNVVIRDTRSTTFVYPVINKGNVIINSLEMHPGTELHLKPKATLTVLDDSFAILNEYQIKQNKRIIKIEENCTKFIIPEETDNQIVRRE